MAQYAVPHSDPVARQLTRAIRSGDLSALQHMLNDQPELAMVRITDEQGSQRSLLHVLSDWPGHTPRRADIAVLLIEAGADVSARFIGFHSETPLHWAASNDDIELIDAFVDAGANIEADGGVIANGTPLADARAFRQWHAAERLIELGAKVSLTDAATLGLLERVKSFFSEAPPQQIEINAAFWGACHGGRNCCADYLLKQGANINWVAEWESLTPLDAAIRSEEHELADWLRNRGAKSAK